MRSCRTLGAWLRRYLEEHVVNERNLAENTRQSYRDSFALLLPFVSRKARKPVDRLTLDDLTADRLRAFLDHVETERGCSVETRNRRLTAVRAFARFVASRDPALVAWCGHIRAIPVKRAALKPVAWLTRPETEALVAVPDRKTARGRTEHAILLFLVNTGARVSEATGLRVGDIAFGQRDGGFAIATLHGKGGKIRQSRRFHARAGRKSSMTAFRASCAAMNSRSTRRCSRAFRNSSRPLNVRSAIPAPMQPYFRRNYTELPITRDFLYTIS